MMLNGSYGNKVVNYQRRWLENPRGTTNLLDKAMHYAVLSKMDPNGPVDYRNIYISGGDADMCRMSASAASSTSNFRFSDKFVEDGSFLRLKTLTISYLIPKTMVQKLRINDLKFFLTATNLWTLTKYLGQDPEVSLSSDGKDKSQTPVSREFMVGINIGF